MRKTKIIGTIGPSSMDYAVMKGLVKSGLNIVRINLSHAKLVDMEKILSNVIKLRKEFNIPLPIILDTRGPEIRVKTFKNGQVEIKKSQVFVFTARNIEGDSSQVSLNLPSVVKQVKIGGKILACNGLLSFKIIDVKDDNIITKAINSGILSNRKSLSIPGVKIKTNYLNEADKKDILWGIKNDIEYVAASFVNSKADVNSLRKFINSHGGKMQIISKIESQCGVDNLDEIIDATDAIMVARGDLGVELAMERLPEIQKSIIQKAIKKNKPVITATEMLESMITNNRPTRAEVSDIANAVYDGTSCVMLSGETANGKFPIDSVKTMSNVACEAEKYIEYNKRIDQTGFEVADCIAQGAISASEAHNINLIFSFTYSGQTVKLMSKYHAKAVVVGATPNERAYRQMELLWGVKPVLTPSYSSTDEMFQIANDIIKKEKLANSKDYVVVTCGTPKKDGGTNLMKIVQIK